MGRKGVRRELWDRLDNESPADYEKFRAYLTLPPGERSLLAAYRLWSDNPNAKWTTDKFKSLHEPFAWEDRARARDAHLEKIRQKGEEAAIEQEAMRQARVAERNRGEISEALSVIHDNVMEFLNSMDTTNMRFSDVVQAVRLKIEYADKFGVGDEGIKEDEWTEEDDELAEEIAERIRKRRVEGVSEGTAAGGEEEGLPPTP